MYNDERICKEVIVDEPEKSERSLKYIIKDWLLQPITRFDTLKLWLTLGHIGLTITLLIKSRKRK